MFFSFAQQPHSCDRLLGIANYAFEQSLEMICHPLDRRPVEQVCVVLKSARKCASRLYESAREVELGRLVAAFD
jgi:hypothetical protein